MAIFNYIRTKSRELRQTHWNVGFLSCKSSEVFSDNKKVSWMKHDYKNRWFADPFILSADEKTIELLVEEFSDSVGRGRIARLVIDRKTMQCLHVSIILELTTHLSFPFIYRKDNKVYVMPENQEGNQVAIYEYDRNIDKLVNPRVIINRHLTDAVLTNMSGVNYLLATEIPMHNKNQLLVFQLDDNLKLVEEKTITFDRFVARNGGDIFTMPDGLSYRIAQDCSKCYGGALEFQKVDIKDKVLSFTPSYHLSPISKWKWDDAQHTFNTYGDLAVVDGRGYRRPFIAKVINFIAKRMK